VAQGCFEVRAGAEVIGPGGPLVARNRITSCEARTRAATPWRHVREGPAAWEHRIR